MHANSLEVWKGTNHYWIWQYCALTMAGRPEPQSQAQWQASASGSGTKTEFGGFHGHGQQNLVLASPEQWPTSSAHPSKHRQMVQHDGLAFPSNTKQSVPGPPGLPEAGYTSPHGHPLQPRGHVAFGTGPEMGHGPPPPPFPDFSQFPAMPPPPLPLPPPAQGGQNAVTDNMPPNLPPPPFSLPHHHPHQQQSDRPFAPSDLQSGPHAEFGQPADYLAQQQNSLPEPKEMPGQGQGWAQPWDHQSPNSFQQRLPVPEPGFALPPPPSLQSTVATPKAVRHGRPTLQPYQSHRIRPKTMGVQRSSAPGNFDVSAPDQLDFKANPEHEGSDPVVLWKQDENESEDQKWVRNWLKGKGRKADAPENEEKKPVVKLGEARDMLARCMQLLDELKKNRDEAADCMTKETDDSQWMLKCQKMKQQMDELASLQAIISSQKFVEDLKKQVELRKRKRARTRRHRQEEWKERQEALKLQEERVNARMAMILQRKQEKEQEEALQKEVDNTLSEVRKKKQDVNKTMELLRALRKLRRLRKDSAEKTGFTGPSELDALFEEKASGLEDLMNRQKLLYVEEERALLVMLEVEHEETRERERRKKQMKERRRAEKALEEELEILFGKTAERLELGQPLFMFRQFHLQAEHDLQALINIRRQWDAFIVPESSPAGSRIPAPWVVPSEPSSHIWATALEGEPSGS